MTIELVVLEEFGLWLILSQIDERYPRLGKVITFVFVGFIALVCIAALAWAVAEA